MGLWGGDFRLGVRKSLWAGGWWWWGGGRAYGRGAALYAAGLDRPWLQRKEPGEWWAQEGELWINTDPRVPWRRAML